MQGARLSRLACWVTIGNLRPVEVGPGEAQKFQARLRDAFLPPLGNGSGIDLAQFGNSAGAVEAVDDLACDQVALVRFHGVDLSTLKPANQVNSNESI